MDLSLRDGGPSDAEICGAICYEAFKTIAEQHHFPPDFPAPTVAIELLSVMFSHPKVSSVVAEVDGRVVGSNFLWDGGDIAGIGPITVNPSVQNGSVGRRLMEHVIGRAREHRFAGIRLVQAAYHNRSMSLYTNLGFNAYEPLSTMQGPALNLVIPGCTVRPATQEYLTACSRLCFQVHGHDRESELLDAMKDKTATVVEHDGRVTGYATVVGFFGHAVGESNDDLKALIGAAPGFPGPGFLLPTRNSELLRWCLQNGLRVIQPMTLMSMGVYHEPKGAFLPSVMY
ncbi:MAG: GNAT family N-acetyltransferase [Nitrospirales bacterium]